MGAKNSRLNMVNKRGRIPGFMVEDLQPKEAARIALELVLANVLAVVRRLSKL